MAISWRSKLEEKSDREVWSNIDKNRYVVALCILGALLAVDVLWKPFAGDLASWLDVLQLVMSLCCALYFGLTARRARKILAARSAKSGTGPTGA